MQVSLRCQPAYSIAYLRLGIDERVYVERGAMTAMSSGIEVEASIGSSGVGRAIVRKVAGQETFFMGRYTARIHGAWIAVAPHLPGDIVAYDLSNGPIAAESGALLAHEEKVTVDVRWAGLRKIALREGATMLRLHGDGVVLLGSYGAVERVDLAEGETVIIDSGHLVAFSAGMNVRLALLGGMATSAVTGEGLVGEFTGPGSVWIQTRAEAQLRDWIFPERAQNRGRR
jgi:uncharacterized protein (TIGR00266 family)